MRFNYFVSATTPHPNEEERRKIEQLVPYTEAKVFRTKSGFIVRDKEDDEWCKFIPFDDVDRLQTDIACKNLSPARIKAMEEMPLPEYINIPKEVIEELRQTMEQAYNQENYDDQLQTVHVAALSYEDDTPGLPSTIQPTREEMLQNHFGTLTPYVDDYIRDSYEIEENHATHLPKLSKSNQRGSSKYGPLSYQHTVLKYDPIVSEDFEKQKEERRKMEA